MRDGHRALAGPSRGNKMTHTPEPRPTLPSLLVYASQLACVAAKAFDIQLAFGAEGARFLQHYEAASETGFAQLPFGSQAQANDVDLLWVLAHRGGEPMGLACARSIPASRGGGLPLADELRRGLLYREELALGSGRGWLPGAGPRWITAGPSLYLGGVWVHPSLRGRGMVAVLSRLVACGMLHKHPATTAVWALEEAALWNKPAARGPAGLGLLEDEKVFEGFFPIIGAPRVMHAVWAPEEKYQAHLGQDWPQLSSRQPPAWLVPLEASYPSI